MEIKQTRITEGCTLSGRHLCDDNRIAQFRVTERKGQFCKVMIHGKIERRKIYVSQFDGEEYIFPYGKHSMAITASVK